MLISSYKHNSYKYCFTFKYSPKLYLYCESLKNSGYDIVINDGPYRFNDLNIVKKIREDFPSVKIDDEVLMDMELSNTTISPFTLRPYQQAAVDAGVRHMELEGAKGGLLVLPTGSGKSLVIASIAQRLQGKTLVLQPSKEILSQNLAKAEAFGFTDIGVFSASMGRKDIGKITFATIGTIISKKELFCDFNSLLIDEAQNIDAKGGQYEEFIRFFGGKCLGLTATPYRNHAYQDMKTGERILTAKLLTRTRPRIFDTILHITQVEEMYKEGFLCPIQYELNEDYDQGKIKSNSTGADFDENSLARYHREKDIVGLTAKNIRSNKSKNALVFTPSVAEAVLLSEELNKDGIKSAIVSAKTPKPEREKILDDFKSGKIKVVSNCQALSVGFDYPELDTVILARPTKSVALFQQLAGRGIRIHPSKKYTRLIDMCGNVARFGKIETFKLVQAPTGVRLQSSAGYLTGVNLASDGKEDLEVSNYKGKEETGSGPGIVTFGKYKGTHVSKLPNHYLKWCIDTFTDGPARTMFKKEMDRRNGKTLTVEDLTDEKLAKILGGQVSLF